MQNMCTWELLHCDGMNVEDALEAGSVVGWNERMVRKYQKNFFENKKE